MYVSNNIWNIITMSIPIIISGLISLLISQIYHKKECRKEVKLNIIQPIMRIVNLKNTQENYSLMKKHYSCYWVKYLQKKEKQVIIDLFNKYGLLVNNSSKTLQGKIVLSYFDYMLSLFGIDMKCIPEDEDGEIIKYDYPSCAHTAKLEFQEIIDNNQPYECAEECEEKLITAFLNNCNEYYQIPNIVFFKDYRIYEVLEKSKFAVSHEKSVEDLNK